jgi:hypothetical protein
MNMSEKRCRPGAIYRPGLTGTSIDPLPADWEFTSVCNFCGVGEWDIREYADGMVIYSCPFCLISVSTWPPCSHCDDGVMVKGLKDRGRI